METDGVALMHYLKEISLRGLWGTWRLSYLINALPCIN